MASIFHDSSAHVCASEGSRTVLAWERDLGVRPPMLAGRYPAYVDTKVWPAHSVVDESTILPAYSDFGRFRDVLVRERVHTFLARFSKTVRKAHLFSSGDRVCPGY